MQTLFVESSTPYRLIVTDKTDLSHKSVIYPAYKAGKLQMVPEPGYTFVKDTAGIRYMVNKDLIKDFIIPYAF